MSIDPSKETAVGGPYGRRIGWLEHEIDWYIQNLIRAGRGLPPLPPPDPAEHPHPVILREKEVHRRTGISRVMRWKLEKVGRFPRRVYLDGLGEETADAA
jgi:predicted DNA-binding transcriptional regulator AlpA